jgi:hypothetical protein
MLDFQKGCSYVFSSWQLEEKTEKSLGELDSSAEGKGALKKEREVHQKLLADSHSLVMDLRWQIHHREKNWNREKVELLERLDSERQEWGRQKEELLWRVEQVGVLQQQPRVHRSPRAQHSPRVHRGPRAQHSPRVHRGPRALHSPRAQRSS